MSRPRNPAARLLADPKFHQRIVPNRIKTLGLGELLSLEEWEDLEGQAADARDSFGGMGDETV